MLLSLILGCADATTCPDGSMSASDEGLVVVESEHPDGWGRAECQSCHALDALHRRACTPSVDMEALREEIDAAGYETCTDCHGDNGVSP